MSNVIDMFGGGEDDDLRASDLFEMLAEQFAGQDKGVATVVICYRPDNPYLLVTGNVEDGYADVMLGTAIVQRTAERLEEEPDVLH